MSQIGLILLVEIRHVGSLNYAVLNAVQETSLYHLLHGSVQLFFDLLDALHELLVEPIAAAARAHEVCVD